MLSPVPGEDPMDTLERLVEDSRRVFDGGRAALRQLADEPEPARRRSTWKRLLGG